jgi:hypothetical protein
MSSLAVYLLGPTVKAFGFGTLFEVMAAIAAATTLILTLLPGSSPAAEG